MLKLTDISFHANTEYHDSVSLIRAQQVGMLYLKHLQPHMHTESIKHVKRAGMQISDHEKYVFFNAKNHFGYLSWRTLYHLKKTAPDIVLINGLIFPIQLILVKIFLGDKTRIIVRHRAERPFKGLKKKLQEIADTYTDAYLFTSMGNAEEWLQQKIIRDEAKVHELPGTLTHFKRLDKTTSRQKTGMQALSNYIWVGRLNDNKDPLAVLSAFEKFISVYGPAKLHFIYQSQELLPALQHKIALSTLLQEHVLLHGYVPHHQLDLWYSAADFFISSSHSEGGSTVLLEAMSCGCIPIATDIPATMRVIDHGKYGLHFSPGNTGELFEKLVLSAGIAIPDYSIAVETHYRTFFSPEKVAQQIFELCNRLVAE